MSTWPTIKKRTVTRYYFQGRGYNSIFAICLSLAKRQLHSEVDDRLRETFPVGAPWETRRKAYSVMFATIYGPKPEGSTFGQFWTPEFRKAVHNRARQIMTEMEVIDK